MLSVLAVGKLSVGIWIDKIGKGVSDGRLDDGDKGAGDGVEERQVVGAN